MNLYKDIPNCEVDGCDNAGILYRVELDRSVCPKCMLKLPDKWIRNTQLETGEVLDDL